MISAIKRAAKDRGISRLCHFTPSRNLPGIAANETGILATRYLREDELAIFTATDALRLDGYADHVSCSIEYPNAWYLAKAEQNDRIFKDWVILFIRPHYLWEEGTRFCPRNAAALGGTLVSSGFEAFESLFARKVRGAYNRLQTRTELHLPCCTTDDQAEVLVPDSIPLSDLIGVAVRNEAQAKPRSISAAFIGGSSSRFQLRYSSDSLLRLIPKPGDTSRTETNRDCMEIKNDVILRSSEG